MDDLDARLRALRPPDTDRHRTLPERAERHLEELMSPVPGQGSPRPLRRRSRKLLLTTMAAVLVLVVSVLGITHLGTGQAQALTPPPLVFERGDQEVGEIVTNAIRRLGNDSDGELPERRSTSLGWYAHVDMDADADEPVVIAPEVTELVWNEDLSGTQRIIAAEAYRADGTVDGSVAQAAPSAGTVIWETHFEPGEFMVPSAVLPEESTTGMWRLLLSLGLPSDSAAAGDIMEFIDAAMGLWTLTDRQHAILFQMLLDAGDVEVLGTTVDRAGRHVVGLRAEPASFPGSARILLISAETGRMVGIETVRTTAEQPFKTGDVVSYRLWEVTD